MLGKKHSRLHMALPQHAPTPDDGFLAPLPNGWVRARHGVFLPCSPCVRLRTLGRGCCSRRSRPGCRRCSCSSLCWTRRCCAQRWRHWHCQKGTWTRASTLESSAHASWEPCQGGWWVARGGTNYKSGQVGWWVARLCHGVIIGAGWLVGGQGWHASWDPYQGGWWVARPRDQVIAGAGCWWVARGGTNYQSEQCGWWVVRGGMEFQAGQGGCWVPRLWHALTNGEVV